MIHLMYVRHKKLFKNYLNTTVLQWILYNLNLYINRSIFKACLATVCLLGYRYKYLPTLNSG